MLLHLDMQYSFFKSILEWKTIFWLAKKKRGRNPHAHYLSLELLFNSIPALAGFLRFSAWSVSETGCCHKQKGSLWKLSVVRRWVWRATALRQCWLPQNALVNALTPQVRALFLAVMKNGFRRMAIGKINQIDSSLMTQIKTWTSVFYGNKTSSSSLITSFCSWQFLQPPYSPPRSLPHSTDVQERFWTTELEGDEVFVKAALFDSNSPRHRIQEVWLMQTVSADKRQSRGSLSAHHSWKCLRFAVLHFQNSCAASGRGKNCQCHKGCSENLFKMLCVTSMIFPLPFCRTSFSRGQWPFFLHSHCAEQH